MKTLRTLALMMLVLAGAGCSSRTEPDTAVGAPAKGSPAAKPSANGPLGFLPTGSFDVDIMEVSMPPRAIELAGRLQAAVSKDPEWFRAHTAAAEPGMPLAYDSRLGLTRAEYDEFLALSKRMGVRRASGARLAVTPGKNGVWVLDGGSDLPELTGITIDPGQDAVRTPFGVAADRSEIDADAETALGAWKGVQWKLESIGEDQRTGTIVKFSLGRLAGSGRGVLYYDVKVVQADGNSAITRILNYDLGAKN